MCVCVCVCVVNGVPMSSLNTAPLQSVQELRGLLDEVRTLKTEREVIETTLRDPVADISE